MRDLKPKIRKKIGQVDSDPKSIAYRPEGLTPPQQALRDAVVNRFTRNKVNKFIRAQINHINFNRHLADGVRILFDEHGKPPANAPVQDIIEARKRIESEIKLLEAICSALRNHLVEIKAIEDAAFQLIADQGEE